MATRAYDSTAEGLAFDTAINCFEIRNPAGSGKLLSASTFVAEVGFTEWLFKRYTGAATTGGAATAVAVHKADTNDANSVMLIYSATAGDIDVSGLGSAPSPADNLPDFYARNPTLPAYLLMPPGYGGAVGEVTP